MILAQTIAQFKLLQHVDENFCPGAVEVQLIDGITIRIEDKDGDAGYLTYDASSREIIFAGEASE